MIKEFKKGSALRMLERSPEKGLGRGNLGVLVARAGVGKTACLIHIAFDRIFRDGRVVHVSLQDGPDKISSYYNVILSELLKAFRLKDERETRTLMEKNRMILAYLNQSFDLRRLRENLKNLSEKAGFRADALVVDGA
jgi:KaiC/GvpD/RAD55 family RecA-like ATPase